MSKRREFELSHEQLIALKELSRQPYIVVNGMPPTHAHPQARVNAAWAALGRKMGFDHPSVQPVPGKAERFFTAIEIEVEKEEQVPYHGYIEVEVRLFRQGHGQDSSGEPGSGYGVEQKVVVRVEEHDARRYADGDTGIADERITAAVKGVLDADEVHELRERWQSATRNLDADRMRAALAVLEGSRS